MAALAATLKARVNAGNKWIELWDVTGSTGIDADDEWVVTGLRKVDGASCTFRGDATPDILQAGPNVVPNVDGTGGAAHAGAVGIRTLVAHITDMDLIVIGE